VRKVDPDLGRFLLAEGPLTQEFIRQQIAVSGKGDTYLGGLLAASKAPQEQTLYRAVAAGYRVPEIDLRQCQVQTSVALSLPREVAFKYQVVALDQIGDLLCVVFAGQPNPKAIEAVRRATGMKVRAFRAPKPLVLALLRRLQEVASPPPRPADDGQ
jgi:type IV pilus assembly protein PilB